LRTGCEWFVSARPTDGFLLRLHGIGRLRAAYPLVTRDPIARILFRGASTANRELWRAMRFTSKRLHVETSSVGFNRHATD
jgi:hypothetical protein